MSEEPESRVSAHSDIVVNIIVNVCKPEDGEPFAQIVARVILVIESVTGEAANLLRPFRRQNDARFHHSAQVAFNVTVGLVAIFQKPAMAKRIVTDAVCYFRLIIIIQSCARIKSFLR